MSYLVKPFTQSDLVPAIEMAVSRFAEIAELEAQVTDLEDRLETRKAVERAKSILQDQLSLTEPEAFRWIQKTAMDLRMSMRRGRRGRRDPRRAGRTRLLSGLPGRRRTFRAVDPSRLSVGPPGLRTADPVGAYSAACSARCQHLAH